MKAFTRLSVVLLFFSAAVYDSAAQCESTFDLCEKHISEAYIPDGQVRWVFLQQDEIAEFETTFFAGNTYRISAIAGDGEGNIIFNILGPDGNELFSNSAHSNAPYWDFKAEFSTLTVRIEALLDANKTSSACGVLLLGLKK
jgi:hypothetical protein